MSEGVTYRLGYLQGRLKAYETEEYLLSWKHYPEVKTKFHSTSLRIIMWDGEKTIPFLKNLSEGLSSTGFHKPPQTRGIYYIFP